jgi:hypothetical protein
MDGGLRDAGRGFPEPGDPRLDEMMRHFATELARTQRLQPLIDER